MIEVPTRTKTVVDRGTIFAINAEKVQTAKNRQTIGNLNVSGNVSTDSVQPTAATSIGTPYQMQIPTLRQTVQKGQKFSLNLNSSSSMVRACFGWNTLNALCDVDVSAFLLDKNGKVLGDDWFVFYGQPSSPDKSVTWKLIDGIDREIVDINLEKINPNVEHIVFVLTINEAFAKNLHFGMLQDAYVRILQEKENVELVSFKMEDYYDNVISMMIGELYRYKGAWKFYAVGNGMAKDLAGICQLYGVEVSD